MKNSSLLPVVPKRGSRVAAADVQAIERRIVNVLAKLNDIDELDEWRARARARET